MRFGVVVFPGSNCDKDTGYVLHTLLGHEVVYLWHKESDLQECDAIVLPGGFSYGDYLRSGALARFSPVMESVLQFVDKGGFVLGICNGFQILCEAGLLPGVLLRNHGQRFVCKNIYLLPEVKPSLPTAGLQAGRAYQIPIAHADGAYYADKTTLASMRVNNQILFRYCDSEGKIKSAVNPNGSVDNIAGICNERGNVVGMMPHPERASDARQDNEDGRRVLESIINFWFA